VRRIGLRQAGIEEKPRVHLCHASSSRSPVWSCRPEASVPTSEDSGFACNRERSKDGLAARQKFWFPIYGNNIPGPDPVLPEELTTPFLSLEGQQFPVTGPVPGSDEAGNSFVFIPSLKAVVTGDIVFDHVYFGVQRDKAREDWTKTIDQILALKPEIIVPGHEGPGAKHDISAIDFMKKYIVDWDVNVGKSKNAAEMRENVLKQYPGLGIQFTLNDRINTYFPAQNQPK
jgi:hypothetical protein